MVVDALGRDINSGKLLRGDNGKLCRGCCGGYEAGETCATCGDIPTPKYLKLTFSGILGCGCSKINLPYTPDISVTSFSGNKSYILTQTSPCAWEYFSYPSDIMSGNIFSSSDCSCSVFIGTFSCYFVRVRFYISSFPAIIFTVGLSDGKNSVGSVVFYTHTYSSLSWTDCVNGTQSNIAACCGLLSATHVSCSGGSCLVEPY